MLCTLPITSAECGLSFIQYTKKVKNIPEVDHVKRARGWAGVDEHQEINIEEAINTFAQRKPRRLMFT